MTVGLTRAELKAAHCWFSVDSAPYQPAMTVFKRCARLHQARWREKHGLPMGGHKQRDKTERPVGSRIDLAHSMRSGANFLSLEIVAAVRHRLDNPQPHQTLQRTRLWSDLLSSMPMCFNLFGELWDAPEQANAAVKAWFPDSPGVVRDLQFEWSPGRRDPQYLGNRSAFDVVFLLDLGEDRQGVLGVETKYHEHSKVEKRPSDERMARYREVTDRSGAFIPDWEAALVGTDLQQIWLDHLLALSMTQHESGAWAWARFVVVHPAGNISFADAAARYRELLVDGATFDVRTLEDLLAVEGALPEAVRAALQERYLF